MEEDALLSIGVFARRARLSPKALRLYDRQGLLPPDRVDPVTGYRHYREGRLADARLIVLLRGLDMPLAQVAEVLAAPDRERALLVARYWDGVERRLTAQRELAVHLRIQLSGREGILDMYEIQHREVPDQLVLTERRSAGPQELPAWIPAATDRLTEAAAAYGGAVAAPFVIYHGEVDEDSDGPVEVCVPIDPSHAGTLAVPGRIEPAHHEVYTRITKAQVEYPQILSAYDALCAWAERERVPFTGPGREVYFTDWAGTGDTEPACDIAFPTA
ncbi:MerR family transcriptional regulator [Kitasatospora sp. NPDC056138]|uniref:MerR family transcriptional regulator n=1 Tax=Kitasatospora sp. NPDC056138 TaxID=3345724 RepID=UPI0035E2815E